MNNYALVRSVIEALPTPEWSIDVIGEADGYPLFAVRRSPSRTPESPEMPRLLVTAGIHGEEPAAVHGLLKWLQEPLTEAARSVALTVLPCINPWGFERGERHGSHGKDLNREFDRPHHPSSLAVVRYLAGRTFDLHMDLHEDSDFDSLYLYELFDETHAGPGSLGRRILDRSASVVPISDGDEVGEMITKRGRIHAQLSREEAEAFEGAPIAVYVYVNHAPYVITYETPCLQPLALRAELHCAALDESVRYLTDS